VKISWLILAEGLATDAKGAYTLVGINQNILFTPTVPAQTKRAIIAHLTGTNEDAEQKMKEASFTFSVLSPSNVTLSATSGQAVGTAFPFPELPATVDIAANFMVPISEFGEYQICLEVRFGDGEVAKAAESLYVMRPPVQREPTDQQS
jgi:hypothetical protein